MKIAVSTQPKLFPAGTVAGNMRFTLIADNGYSNNVVLTGLEADFPDATAPGTYTATVQRLDGSGNDLGASATAIYTIEGTNGVLVDMPITVTVSMA